MTLPRISQILARRPAVTMANGLTSHPGQPSVDVHAAQQAFDAYLTAFRDRGLEVSTLPADDHHPDGHYVEDTAVIYRELVFITRPGAPQRAAEVQAMADHLQQHLPTHHFVRLDDPQAYLEGGDVLFTAARVLIGISARTNRAGAAALRTALLAVDRNLRVDMVPLTGVLHLKSGLTELAPGLLLKAPSMQMAYTVDFAEVIALPAAEGYAANVLPINDDFVLIASGFPTVARLASQHYADVVAIDMRAFALMDGGLTCLSLRY